MALVWDALTGVLREGVMRGCVPGWVGAAVAAGTAEGGSSAGVTLGREAEAVAAAKIRYEEMAEVRMGWFAW
jgi:hypothetical protein